jgi:hypothetical protein
MHEVVEIFLLAAARDSAMNVFLPYPLLLLKSAGTYKMLQRSMLPTGITKASFWLLAWKFSILY